MSGKGKIFGISFALLLLLESLATFYLLSGASDANTLIEYRVDIWEARNP